MPVDNAHQARTETNPQHGNPARNRPFAHIARLVDIYSAGLTCLLIGNGTPPQVACRQMRCILFTMLADQFEALKKIISDNHEAVVERFEVVEKKIDGLDDALEVTDRRVAAVESKVDGINRRLDTDAVQRTDQNVPGRIEAIEKHLGLTRAIAG